jgi:hypothetical protein
MNLRISRILEAILDNPHIPAKVILNPKWKEAFVLRYYNCPCSERYLEEMFPDHINGVPIVYDEGEPDFRLEY